MEKRTFEYIVNGIKVDAVFRETDIEEIYLPLLRKLTELRKRKNGRVIAMIAAPPGAGKTTLCRFLQEISEKTDGLEPVTAIGMDGFHRYRMDLASHTTERDGETVPLSMIKGAPITFDLEKLTAKVKELSEGSSCLWPDYSRVIHDPVENAFNVTGQIVLLEGNYLLLDEPGWRDLKNYADYTVRLTANEAEIRERLIDRKMRGSGFTRAAAERHVAYSDLYNFRKIREHALPADLTICLRNVDG